MTRTIAIAAAGPVLAYLLGAYVMADINVLHWTMGQREGNAVLMIVFFIVSSLVARASHKAT